MDMEAGVEHLGRATAQGVDTMLVVVEPGQRSIDCAKRVQLMANEIGLKDFCVVANKVMSDDDEAFVRQAFPDCELVGVIPYSERIRQADRRQISVLNGLTDDERQCFENILKRLEERIGR
jgi:CO dehydrogenase maturation factor